MIQTSTGLASGVIFRALHQRANFYSACVYLAQSNACLMVVTVYFYKQNSKIAESVADTDQSCLNWTLQYDAGCPKVAIRAITSF